MSDKFWASPDVEPKRNFKWRVFLSFSHGGIADWVAKSVDRPWPEINTEEHNYLIHTFKYPGTVNWKDVEMTLVDPISVNAVSNTLRSLHESGYIMPNDITGAPDGNELSTLSKRKATNSIEDFRIRMLDAEGDPVNDFTLKNAFFSDFDGSTLEYGEDGLSELNLTVTYDFPDFEERHEEGPNVLPPGYDSVSFAEEG